MKIKKEDRFYPIELDRAIPSQNIEKFQELGELRMTLENDLINMDRAVQALNKTMCTINKYSAHGKLYNCDVDSGLDSYKGKFKVVETMNKFDRGIWSSAWGAFDQRELLPYHMRMHVSDTIHPEESKRLTLPPVSKGVATAYFSSLTSSAVIKESCCRFLKTVLISSIDGNRKWKEPHTVHTIPKIGKYQFSKVDGRYIHFAIADALWILNGIMHKDDVQGEAHLDQTEQNTIEDNWDTYVCDDGSYKMVRYQNGNTKLTIMNKETREAINAATALEKGELIWGK